ncbi:hypothetical protein [Actinoplanes sichuanensis]|uniref:Uncharacterized protein n=1 Tax=Actinoplanes sichuanensis TaxID=512349 RepID=A0ABW4A827_9ACTN|nr:hypothetical protein [Actinoplanes sichuanensis]
MPSTDIPNRARNHRRHARLFDGADTGLYTLPAELLAARDGLVRLSAELAVAPPSDRGADQARYVTALMDAATAGEPLPTLDELTAADRRNRQYDRRSELLVEAIDRADSALELLVNDLGDRIIRDHLAPVVDDIMKGVTAAAGALPDDTSADTILRASDKARKAWLGLDDLAARYEAVRAAAVSVRRNTPAEWDHRGDFSELHNFHELTAGLNIQIGGPRPWPTKTSDRLLWYARNNGRVWMPTVAEQDARYREVHKDALDAMAENRARVSAARHAFG